MLNEKTRFGLTFGQLISIVSIVFTFTMGYSKINTDIMNMQIVGRTITLNVFFDESGYHQSGDGLYGWHDTEWQGTGETVNTAYLLNYGYEVKKNVWFKNIENFGHREPAHFIEDGIADFEMYNPYGIIVQVHKPNGYKV